MTGVYGTSSVSDSLLREIDFEQRISERERGSSAAEKHAVSRKGSQEVNTKSFTLTSHTFTHVALKLVVTLFVINDDHLTMKPHDDDNNQ
jgi:hypothetical protein